MCVIDVDSKAYFSLRLQMYQHQVDLLLAGTCDPLIINYHPHLSEEEADKAYGFRIRQTWDCMLASSLTKLGK